MMLCAIVSRRACVQSRVRLARKPTEANPEVMASAAATPMGSGARRAPECADEIGPLE
jgi:hypothetical protein